MLLELLFGALVGAVLGLMGGGGSALAVPLLAYGLGLGAREAIATSLVVVGLAAAAGAARHWIGGTVDLRVALVFGVLGALGGAAGAQFARFIPPSVHMTVFGVAILAAAWVMFLKAADGDSGAGQRTPLGLYAVLAALGVGTLTGLAGIGGGFIVVPILVALIGMPMRSAVGTSLLIITFNAFAGLTSYASYTRLDTALILPFAGAAMLAAVAATVVARRIGEPRLRSAFAVGLVIIGILTIVKEGFGL